MPPKQVEHKWQSTKTGMFQLLYTHVSRRGATGAVWTELWACILIQNIHKYLIIPHKIATVVWMHSSLNGDNHAYIDICGVEYQLTATKSGGGGWGGG